MTRGKKSIHTYMCMQMYLCICTYVYTYDIHTYIYIHTYTYICIGWQVWALGGGENDGRAVDKTDNDNWSRISLNC